MKDTTQTDIAVMKNDLSYIKREVIDIKVLVQQEYVTRAEFDPIKKIVYGLVGIILTGVAGALLTLVLKQ